MSIDLSELQNLNLGPAWGSAKVVVHEKKQHGARNEESARPQRAHRPDRRKMLPPGEEKKKETFVRPEIDVLFYPDESAFSALTKVMRTTCITYELFNIAQTLLQKNDRFVAILKPKQDPNNLNKKLYTALCNGMPFETEEEAINYVIKEHLADYFNIEEVEIEQPKGSFQSVAKCGLTGELLAPTNYHKYQQILQEHYHAKILHMSYEKFLARIETVRDADSINAWLQKMTKGHRYTYKKEKEGKTFIFDNQEAVRNFLITSCKDEIVKAWDSVRLAGKAIENVPSSRLKRLVEFALQRQLRFPLDTANNIRGRLRRMGFHIYKRGNKGVSYVCSAKRKNRDEKTTFATPLQNLITFIEKNPSAKASNLSQLYLQFPNPATTATTEGSTVEQSSTPSLSAEQQEQLKQLKSNLRWLVSEGFVIEHEDGRLIASPVVSSTEPTTENKEDIKEDIAEEVAEEVGEELAEVAEVAEEQPQVVEVEG